MTKQAGASLIETVFAVGVLSVAGVLGTSAAADWRDRARIEGAARMVLGQVRMARALAVREGTHVAIVFRADGAGDFSFTVHRDGNGNGVRREEADSNVDPPLGSGTRLSDWFPGTTFRVPISLPPLEDGAPVPAGSSGVRLAGGSSVLSCSPTGTTTSGTVYVAGRRGEVFAVRLLGATGRVRIFEHRSTHSDWIER